MPSYRYPPCCYKPLLGYLPPEQDHLSSGAGCTEHQLLPSHPVASAPRGQRCCSMLCCCRPLHAIRLQRLTETWLPGRECPAMLLSQEGKIAGCIRWCPGSLAIVPGVFPPATQRGRDDAITVCVDTIPSVQARMCNNVQHEQGLGSRAACSPPQHSICDLCRRA